MSESFDDFERAAPAGESFDDFAPVAPQKPAAKDVLRAVSAINPEEAARADALARKYKSSPDPMLQSLQSAELEDAVNRGDEVLKTSPKLARALTEKPWLAAQTHDDLEPLTQLESSGAARSAAAVGQAVLGMSESIWRTPDAAQRMVGYLAGQIERTGLPWQLNPVRGVQDVLRFASEGRVPGVQTRIGAGTTGIADKIGEAQQVLTDRDTFGNAFADLDVMSKNADQALRTLLERGQGGQLAQVLSSPDYWAVFIAQAAPSLYTAMKSGGSLAFMGWLEGMEQASNAADFEKRTGTKISDAEFSQAVLQTALINAVLEKSGLDKVVGARGQGIKGVVKAIFAEGGTEGLQQLNSNIAAALSYDPDKPLTEGVVSSVMGGAGAGGGAATASSGAAKLQQTLDARQSKLDDAQKHTEQLQAAMQAAAKSKLRERSPESFRELVDQITSKDDGQPDSIFVDAQVLSQMPLAELQAALPTAAAQLEEALATNSTVEIPLGEALTAAPGTPLEQLLLQNARRTPDALSVADAEAAQEQTGKMLRDDAARVIQEATDQEATQASAERVKQNFIGQLATAGRTRADVNEAYATVMRDFYTVLGGTLKVTPEEAYTQYPYRVVAGTQQSQNNNTLSSDAPGASLQARIATDYNGAVAEYSALPDTDGGRVLNVDTARELSPEYRADRTRSAEVHEPSSAFIKRVYAEKLKQPTPAGKAPYVLFTAGGTGAGKSTGLTLMGETAAAAEIIYDTNMNGFESSDLKIRQALEAGREVRILYVYRDPVEALTAGALPRAMRMGRTVPLREHARTHAGAKRTMLRLAEKYKNDPRVQITVVDNSKGMGQAAEVALANVPEIDENGLEGKLSEAAKTEYEAGRVSEAVYRGTAGTESADGQRAGQGLRGQSEQADQAEVAKEQRKMRQAVDLALVDKPTPAQATVADFAPDKVQGILDLDGWAILTAENPNAQPATPEANAQAQAALEADLTAMGAEFTPAVGKYGQVENSYVVTGVTEEEAVALGRKYGQESVLTRRGLVYGDGRLVPATGVQVYETAPEDFYTEIPGTGALFGVDLDFEGETLAQGPVQTETPEFKKWFGNSKVVDDQGKPLVVMHASTYGDITEFDKKEQRFGKAGFGFYFSDAAGANLFSEYGDRFQSERSAAGEQKAVKTYPVYLSLQNPLVVDHVDDLKPYLDAGQKFGVGRGIFGNLSPDAMLKLQRQGYDGIITRETTAPRVHKTQGLKILDRNDPKAVSFPVYVAFEPEQIKSATGNRGTFNANDPSILNQGPVSRGVDITGVHFSRESRRALQGAFYGTGLKGLEGDRVTKSGDPRLKSRVYFYVDEGKGVRPEAGVGGAAHEAKLKNLYDAKADPLRLWRGDINDIESRILDSGFDGYYVRDAFNDQGAAVVLGNAARYIETKAIENPTTAAPVRAEPPKPYKRGLLSRELNKIDATKLQAAAPSAKIESGNLTVDRGEFAAAQTAAREMGVELPDDGVFNQGPVAPDQLVAQGVLRPVGNSAKGVKVYRAIADGEAATGPRAAGSWVTPNRDIAVNVYARGDATRVVEDYIPQRDLYEAHPDGWVYAPAGTDLSDVVRAPGLTFGRMLQDGQLNQVNRGTFNPKTLTTTLLETADLSTFLHETGHFFLEVMADVASRVDAPATARQDMDAVMQWFGVESLEKWRSMTLDEQRPYHEKFAEAFEQYLFEGKAPKAELKPVFRRLRGFMIQVYKSLAAFTTQRGGQINDDIRGVFDRLLATEQEITENESTEGMLPDFDATNTAIEQLAARSLRDMRWAVNARNKILKQLQRDVAAKRKAVEAEVKAEVEAQPVYAARIFLRETKLMISGLEEMYSGEGDRYALLDWKPLVEQKMAGKEGVHPDVAADALGFTNGDALVRAVLEAEPIASVIEGMTDQRMLERYGDVATPEAREQAATEAIHNDVRARLLATELKAQTDALNPREQVGTASNGRAVTVNALVEAAKEFAKNIAGRRTLKELKRAAQQHRAAEARAGKEWQAATSKGDTRAAVQAKRDQMLNHFVVRELVAAQAEAKKAVEFFRRVTKDSNEKTVEKGRDPDVVNAMRAVLAAYGVAPRLQKSALEYMELVSQHDPAMYQALKPSVDGAIFNAKPLESLTTEELRALHDEMKAMWDLARRSRQMEVDGNLMDIDDAAALLGNRMEEIGIPLVVPGERRSIGTGEEAGIKLQFAKAILSRVEQWAERMDGKFGGPFLRLVFQPIKESADRYRTDKVKYRERFVALLRKVEPALRPGPIEAPELNYTFGAARDSGTAEMLHAILHTGNESNKRKLLLGRQWATENTDGTLDTSRWDAFITRMHNEGKLAKVHYDFAQGVWDLLDSMKPLAQETHRKVFGRYFKEITADAFETPFGAYRGGYVPAQTDSRLVNDAALRELAEGENEAMAYAFPSAPSGFTKGRVEYNRPLLLDLRALAQHMDKVILFSHMQGAVNDVRRLLTRKGVSSNLSRLQPGAYEGMLLPWLNRSARQIVETPVAGDRKLSRFLSAARSRAGMALMFANISNTVQQITGFSLAAVKVRPGLLLKAAGGFMAHPLEMRRNVAETSEFMRARMESEIVALNDVVAEVLMNPSVYEKAQAWTQQHAYFMQAAVDNTMSVMVWTAAYNQATGEGFSHADAVRFADGTVRQSQGTTLPEDISRFESGPAYGRLFTQFISYFNMMANTNATALSQISQEMGLRKGAGKALYVALVGLLIPIWVSEAIATAFRGGPEDDDDDGYLDDWLAAVFGLGTLRGLLAQVPLVGQAAQLVVNRFNDRPADDKFSLSPAVSIIESAVGSPASVYKAIVDDGNKQKAVRDTAAAATLLTGLPFYAASRPLGYAVGVEQGKIRPTSEADAVRGLVTGTASPESRGR